MFVLKLLSVDRISEVSSGNFIIIVFSHGLQPCNIGNNCFKFGNWLQQKIRSNFMVVMCASAVHVVNQLCVAGELSEGREEGRAGG